MRDLTSARAIHAKGALFLALGLMSAALLLAESPTLRTAFLLACTVWASCRFYYYLFYVIGRYVDPSFRFAGVLSAVAHVVRRRR